MRYIHFSERHVPSIWLQKAEDAFEEVCECLPENRNALVNSKSRIWSSLKNSLINISSGKCWYCETAESRSHLQVDHFRPKNRVAEAKEHEGYWWLAFNWSNYRLACTFCNCLLTDDKSGNTLGKADHFPLIDENNRAKTKDDDISNEFPCLLDPNDPLDPPLLWFDETGKAMPKFGLDENATNHTRAESSIKYYNLNHVLITENRKALYWSIKRELLDCHKYFIKAMNGETSAKDMVRKCMISLASYIQPNAEYSVTAKCILMGFRADFEWVDDIFQIA